MINIENNPPIPPKPSALGQFSKDVKASIEILKNQHNFMGKALTALQEEHTKLKENYNELKNFLIINNKRFRRYFHKEYLKNKFK